MKPAALTHVNTAAEKEAARLVTAIETQQRQVEELIITVETLASELSLFERRYTAHISQYYLELDKVELEMKEYRLRLQLRRENVSADEIETRVESCFRTSRARVNAYAEDNESPVAAETEKRPETETKTLQTLYRSLAKRYHPDKAVDPEEAERREHLMPLINRAYQEHDMETLERLSLGDTEITAAEKQGTLRAALRKLQGTTSELRLEINRLKTGRTYQLKQQVETAETSGRDLLSELARDLERKVKASRTHLARLIEMWHGSA